MKRFIEYFANQIGKIIVVKTGDEFDEVTTYYMQTSDGWRRLEGPLYSKGVPLFAFAGEHKVVKNLDFARYKEWIGPLVVGEKIKTPIQVFAAPNGSQFQQAGKLFYKKGDKVEFEGKLYGPEGISHVPDSLPIYVGAKSARRSGSIRSR